MLIGYARVSTRDQKPHLQLDALREAGCERIFEETASGAKRERPELTAALDFMRSGDSLVVWKLDRLARSTRQLLETVEALERRGIGLKILTQNMDTASAGGRLIFTVGLAQQRYVKSHRNCIICWNYLYLSQKLAEIDDPAKREELLQAMAHGSAAAWGHLNLLGEYDFSEDKLQDSVGIKPPKLTD